MDRVAVAIGVGVVIAEVGFSGRRTRRDIRESRRHADQQSRHDCNAAASGFQASALHGFYGLLSWPRLSVHPPPACRIEEMQVPGGQRDLQRFAGRRPVRVRQSHCHVMLTPTSVREIVRAEQLA